MKKEIFRFIFIILVFAIVLNMVSCEFSDDNVDGDDLPISVKSIAIDESTIPVKLYVGEYSDIFDMREFHASLKNNLEYYKMPKYIKVIDSIPRSPKGSILYAKLKEIQL